MLRVASYRVLDVYISAAVVFAYALALFRG